MKKKSFSDILDDISEAGLARMRRKAPEWADTPGIEFPTRLATEQCSSSATADYKSALVRRIRPGCRLLLDLTGGLGIDCAAFSRVSERVVYNEMDPALEAAAERNFARLGIDNVSFSCIEATEETLPVLTADGPDIIFLDPARRSGSGRKVFLLEDCSPDVLRLKAGLLAAAPDILVKLSPMADITMVCKRLGPEVREVHVVGADGECKEILAWIQRGWSGECSIVAEGLRFTSAEESACAPLLLPDRAAVGGILFEPSPTLLKAGCFNIICERLGLCKLGRFTHLYLAAEHADSLRLYGKSYTIKDVLSFEGRNIKALGKAYPKCSVTSRNLPVGSDTLAKKMGVTSGGDTHIFAFTADFTDAPSERLMVVTERI